MSQRNKRASAGKEPRACMKGLLEYVLYLEGIKEVTERKALQTQQDAALSIDKQKVIELLETPGQALVQTAAKHGLVQLLLDALTNSMQLCVKEPIEKDPLSSTAAVAITSMVSQELRLLLESLMHLIAKSEDSSEEEDAEQADQPSQVMSGQRSQRQSRYESDQQSNVQCAQQADGVLLAKQLVQVDGTGFVPALVKYTHWLLDSLEQLAAAAATTSNVSQQTTSQSQSNQQSVDSERAKYAAHIKRYCTLYPGVNSMLYFWHVLLACCTDVLQQHESFSSALTAVARLSAVSYPLLSRALPSKNSRTSAIKWLNERFNLPNDIRDLSYFSIKLAHAVVYFLAQGLAICPHCTPNHGRCECPRQQRLKQDLLQSFQAGHFSSVLVMTLIHQALPLHQEYAQQSVPSAPDHDQQQRQQQWSKLKQRMLQSHDECMNSLGLVSTEGQQNSSIFYFDEGYSLTSALAIFNICLTSSSKAVDSDNTGQPLPPQPQQQQQCRTSEVALPSHLVQPTVRLLMEIVLLLPSQELIAQIGCLELIMLLLEMSVAPPAAAAASQQSTTLQTSALRQPATGAWPALSAVAAAGLLQPVIQLLSRGVVQTLIESELECVRQDLQEAGELQEFDFTAFRSQRSLLLHYFGRLLVTVCQAVEPKHIAAALRFDPVIPLVAIEAVIRAQACHLVLDSYKQQQQQQSSLDKAEVLLPFVSKVVSALHDLVQNKQLIQNSSILSETDSDQVVDDLHIRLVSIAATACKVTKAAMTAKVKLADPSAAAAVSSVAGAAASPANPALQASSASVPSSLTEQSWLPLVHACMEIATVWNNTLKASDCSSLDELLMPVAVLLQAIGVLGAAVPMLMTERPKENASPPVVERVADMLGQACAAVGDMTLWARIEAAMQDGSCDSKWKQLILHQAELLQDSMEDPSEETSICAGGATLTDPDHDLEAWEQQTGVLCQELHDRAIEASGGCPIPFFCNNPSCVNLSKLSEYQLVSGKACVCGGCKVARYCNSECQKQHRKQHKPLCQYFHNVGNLAGQI